MPLDVQEYVEISRLATSQARIAIAARAQACAIIDTCWNVNFDTCGLVFAAFATAVRTRV